ncbi:MAG: 30S ribosomal protein S16 [Acidobacteriota bacterium]
MLKIRLRRMGARNQPYYRVVVSDSRQTSRAEVLEEIGSYHPLSEPAAVSINRDRAQFWIGRGAAVSPTVRSLLARPEAVPAASAAKTAPAASPAPPA